MSAAETKTNETPGSRIASHVCYHSVIGTQWGPPGKLSTLSSSGLKKILAALALMRWKPFEFSGVYTMSSGKEIEEKEIRIAITCRWEVLGR